MKNGLKCLMPFVLVILLTSCDKDNDESVSLAGLWTIESVSTTETESGLEAFDTGISGALNIKPDGTYTHDFAGSAKVGAFTKLGTWESSSDNQVIYLNNNSGDSDGPMVLNLLTLTASNLSFDLKFFEGQRMNSEGSSELIEKNLVMNFTK